MLHQKEFEYIALLTFDAVYNQLCPYMHVWHKSSLPPPLTLSAVVSEFRMSEAASFAVSTRSSVTPVSGDTSRRMTTSNGFLTSAANQGLRKTGREREREREREKGGGGRGELKSHGS